MDPCPRSTCDDRQSDRLLPRCRISLRIMYGSGELPSHQETHQPLTESCSDLLRGPRCPNMVFQPVSEHVGTRNGCAFSSTLISYQCRCCCRGRGPEGGCSRCLFLLRCVFAGRACLRRSCNVVSAHKRCVQRADDFFEGSR